MMKSINLILLVFLVLCINLNAKTENTEQITIPLSYPGEPGTLIIDHYKGSIHITGYNGDVVIVKAELRYPEQLSEPKGLKRITSNSIKLNATEKDNRVTIQSNSINKTIDLKIEVPVNFSLKLQNYDNGEIKVHNLSGEMEISNINGDINLNSISGSALLNSVDGNIIVKFKEVTSGVPMAFTTLEGKIDLTLPANLNALLKMKSEQGEIFSDFNLDIKKREAHSEYSQKSGINKIFLEEYTYGRLNNGGPEILCRSFNGNIYIRKLEE